MGAGRGSGRRMVGGRIEAVARLGAGDGQLSQSTSHILFKLPLFTGAC